MTSVVIALASALCFALALLVTQVGLRHMPPLAGAAISVPTATALFWLAAPFTIDVAAIDGQATAIFAAVGLLFPAAVTVLTFAANRHMGPTVSGALGNLTPLVAVLGAFIVLGERPGPAQLGGLAVIVAGVLLLSWPAAASGASGWPLWALLLPLSAAAIRGAIQPAVKVGLALWPAPFAAGLIGYSVSSLVLLAVAARAGALGGVTPRGAAAFAGVGLFNGSAVLLLYVALTGAPVSVVSPLVATYPLFTLALGAVASRAAPLGARAVAGVVLSVAGVMLLLAG
jgi:drug/metabolite transporter (DMT)-like permease